MALDNVVVCVLCKNSATDLQELAPTLSRFGAVILADDGSSDDTIAMARAQGWRLVDVQHTSSFAERRHAAVMASSHAWVFFLDTDERVSEQAIEVLSELTNSNAQKSVAGYELEFLTYFAGAALRHGGASPLWVLRLFRRDCYRGFFGDVHERAILDGIVARAPVVLDHYSYRSTRHYVEKINRYTDLEADELSRNAAFTPHPPWRSLLADGRQTLASFRQSPTRQVLRDSLKMNYKNRYVITRWIWLYPILRFLNLYVLRRGFLDGGAGLKYSSLAAAYSIIKYAKAFERKT